MNPDELKNELKKQLDELQISLKHASEAQMKPLADQIKALEEKLQKAEEASKGIDYKAISKGLEDLKKEVSDILAAMKIREEAEKENQKLLNETATKVKSIKDFADGLPGKKKTLSSAIYDVLKEEDNAKDFDMFVSNHREMKKRITMDIKAVGDMSISGNYSGGSRMLQVADPNFHAGPTRRVHIRDIVPGGTIGKGTEFVFMRENGVGEGAPSPVAEGWTKAQMDMDLIESSVKIETIAGWMRVTRKAMDNIPGFVSWLQMRLPQRLLNIEDAQLLQGNGTTPNIKGIMTAGNYTAATTSSQLLVEQLIDGLSQLEDTNERYADGILLRPREYYRFFKTKAGGSKEYDLPKNVAFANGTLYISGVPVYQSTAVPAGKYIIGDFSEGCQLLVQDNMRLEFFEQDGTNARENKITVRIEETVAFPVYGSDYFIVGDVGVNSITS